LPISRSSQVILNPNFGSTPASSSTVADPRPSRISTSVQDGMSCWSTARGRSPTAK
jgi:hypothetical protein